MYELKYKVHEHLLGCDKKTLESYINQIDKANDNKHQSFELLEDKDEIIEFILNSIIEEYLSCKIELIDNGNERVKEIKCQIELENEKNLTIDNFLKIIIIYRDIILTNSDVTEIYLNKYGIKMNNRYFINIPEIEIIFLEILKTNNYINFSDLLLLIITKKCTYFDQNIISKITNHDEIIQYDGRKNLHEFEKYLINLKRRLKYNSLNKKSKNPSDKYIEIAISQSPHDIDKTIDLLRVSFNPSMKRPFKEMIQDVFQHSILQLGRKEFLNVYKEFFYYLFEDNKKELLSENKFALLQKNKRCEIGDYDGSYEKYYSTRIKTLTGI